jgi:hypothetical protein
MPTGIPTNGADAIAFTVHESQQQLVEALLYVFKHGTPDVLAHKGASHHCKLAVQMWDNQCQDVLTVLRALHMDVG